MSDSIAPVSISSSGSTLGGPNSIAFLQVLQDMVQSTNAQAEIIRGNFGAAASGDVSGTYPGPLTVTLTHLAAPLPLGQGGTGNLTGQPSGTAGGSLAGTYPNPTFAAGVAITNLGLAAGNTGGIVGFTATGVLGSSATLGAGQIILGAGAGAVPTALGSLGTTTTVLHGNAAGPPSYGPVVLTTSVSGTLPVANGGTGNTTGQPSGTAGGDLTGTYPNPTLPAPATWVPVLRFGGASVGITYGTQSGTYIRVGKLLIAHFTIILTANGASVGAATIAGLPNTCATLDGAVLISSHAAMTANVFECAVGAGTTIIVLGKGNAAGSSALVDTDFTATTAITGTATYITT